MHPHKSLTIQTGRIPLSYLTVTAILSLSLVVNLPGLAISPMLETIKQIFPDSTELETQLLTLLPNLLIIPFVLLSGVFSMSRHKLAVIITGLVIFAASAVAYLFASSMTQLIIYSCTLGIGAGIIVPFSTGLIADTFTGAYRMREMGIQSGIANLTLVVSTFIVGWLQHGDWHLPFLVYLVVLIPLFLAMCLRSIPAIQNNGDFGTPIDIDPRHSGKKTEPKRERDPEDICPARFRANGFSYGRTAGVFILYFLITSVTIVISYYTPFLCNHRGWSESLTGTVTSIYFLFIFLPGFFLSPILRILKKTTIYVCIGMALAGLAIFVFCPTPFTICLGAVLCGFGYGVIQPIMYDKATRIVDQPSKATLALSIILAANYLAIVLTPFVTDGVMHIFRQQENFRFPFLWSMIITAVMMVLAYICRKRFCVYISPMLYGEAPDKACGE